MTLLSLILILQNPDISEIPSGAFQLSPTSYAYIGFGIFIYVTIFVLALFLYYKIVTFLNLKIKHLRKQLDSK